MSRAALTVLIFLSIDSWACPNLTGKYMQSSDTTLHVSQKQEKGVEHYSFTSKSYVCRKCEYREVYHADGQTRGRKYLGGDRVEAKTVSCQGDRLQIRLTTKTYDRGSLVSDYSESYDYRLNSRGGLVEEELKDGQVYRSSTFYRLTDEAL